MQRLYLGFLKAPLFSSAILFGIGIAFASKFQLSQFYLIVIIFSLIFSALLPRLILTRKRWLGLYFMSFLISLTCIIFLGDFYYQVRIPKRDFKIEEVFDSERPVWVEARARGLSRDYQRYSRVLCELIWLDRGKGREKISGRFLLNYYEERKIYPGDKFIALVRLHPLRSFKNPTLADSSLRYQRSGVYFSASQLKEMPIWKIYKRTLNPLAWLDRYRLDLKEEIKRSGVKSSYLLLALLLGDRSEIPESVLKDFRTAGSAHILVVSGLHLSLVSAFCFLLFLGFFRVQPWFLKRVDPYPLAGILSIIPTSLYAVLSGLGIPVVRAYLMVLIMLFAISVRRIRALLNSLGIAGLVIMLIEPCSVFDPSFQLSFLAVAVLIIYFPILWKVAGGNWFSQERNLLRLESNFFRASMRLISLKLMEYLYALFLASFLIQLFTVPITCSFFLNVSLIGPLTNLLIIPVCGFWTLPLGLAGLFLSLFFPELGGWFLSLAGASTWLMEKIIILLAQLPYSAVLVRPATGLELCGWFLLLMSILSLLRIFSELAERRKREEQTQNRSPKEFRSMLLKFSLPLVLFAFGLGFMCWGHLSLKRFRPEPKEARITMMDVGLGQSLLIDLPGRSRILIDGGGELGALNLGEAVVARYLLNQGIRELDLVILSHPQQDHGAGLKYILSNFAVKEFWLPEKSNALSSALVEIANSRGIKVREVNSHTPPKVIGNARLEVLHPAPEEVKYLSLNDSSLVIKMSYGSINVLFPGEVSQKIEKKLASKYSDQLKSQVLIAPHHGSESSSSSEFLNLVAPRLILISAGQGFGLKFPAQSALKRMEKTQAYILRTDQDGAVQVSLKNHKIFITTASGLNFRM